MEWSEIMQPPQYLKATRLAYLNNEFSEIIAKHCCVSEGSYVLEVGCGTGCFSKYLSQSLSNVDFVCIDWDQKSINNAQEMSGNNNHVEYIQGSAYELPFGDHVFDAVYSHTFFNCAEQPQLAMEEMKRVVKHGGPITSVTSMSLNYETWNTGDYPAECEEWKDTINVLSREMLIALERLNMGSYSLNKGHPASNMPSFFSKSGLDRITIFPMSRAFSLSNAAMSQEEKRTYIDNLFEGEILRLEGAMACHGFLDFFSEEKCRLLREAYWSRRNFWAQNLEDNSIWDWFGSSSLVVTGYTK